MPTPLGLIKLSAPANVNNPQGGDEIIFHSTVDKCYYAKNAAGVFIPLGNFITGAPGFIPTPTQGYNILWQCTIPSVGYVTNGFYSRNYLGADTLISNPSILAPGTPTAVAGAGAGTGPTITILGNDNVGQINILTGSAPSAGPTAVIATVTLGIVVYHNYAMPVLQPSNAPAAELAGKSGDGTSALQIYPIGPKSWGIANISVALAATTGYQFTYIVSGY